MASQESPGAPVVVSDYATVIGALMVMRRADAQIAVVQHRGQPVGDVQRADLEDAAHRGLRGDPIRRYLRSTEGARDAEDRRRSRRIPSE